MTFDVCFFDRLPSELLDEILAHLEPRSIASLSSTSSFWYDYIERNSKLWRCLCSKYAIHSTPVSGVAWKQHFIEQYPRALYVKRWIDGDISRYTSDEIVKCKMFALDAETWGKILDAELSRN